MNIDTSRSFPVKIGLRQGSALSPLLFVTVMELVSRKCGNDPLTKPMYADDLVVMADDEKELEGKLEVWRAELEKHGLKINKEKTEVMRVGRDSKSIDISLDGTKLKQVQNFVYLGGAVSENGKIEVEVKRRVKAGSNAFRKVEGVMMDGKLSRKLKGKVLSTCVVPACTYGVETMALTEEHQRRLQLCENNWTRRITRVKRIDKRRLKDLREEIGLKTTLTKKVTRNRLNWAGKVARMSDDRLPKRALIMEREGNRERGRPRLRWKDRVRNDLRNTGAGEEWNQLAQDRKLWNVTVKQATAIL